MLEISRLPKSLNIPVQVLQPIIQHGVIMPYHAQIRLEMLYIYRIEAHDRRIRKEIQLSERVAEDIWTAVSVQQGFEPVQRREQRDHVLLVVFLCPDKARFVYARANERCQPGTHVVDFRTQ